MNYWLMKSEPLSFSIDDLQALGTKTTPWDGIRNYQVRNMLRDDIKPKDLAFFYHSSCDEPGIVGIMEVASKGHPDKTAFDPEDHHYDPTSDPATPRWYCVDVKFKRKFKRVLSLDELRQHPELENMLVLRRGNRLSITPVSKTEWDVILKLA